MVSLSLRCARVAIAGEAYQQVLADGVAPILRTDGGAGVVSWAGPIRHPAGPVDVVMMSGGPSMTGGQKAAGMASFSRHPSFDAGWRSGPVHRVSDLTALPEFWQTDVWACCHGLTDGRYPAAAILMSTAEATVFLGVHRTGRDFDDEDMAILDLVREPLGPALAFRAAWQNAIDRCRADVREPVGGPLTTREEQILGLVALGWTSARIGRHLRIAERTVRQHLANVNDKLGTANRTAAVDRWRAHSVLAQG